MDRKGDIFPDLDHLAEELKIRRAYKRYLDARCSTMKMSIMASYILKICECKPDDQSRHPESRAGLCQAKGLAAARRGRAWSLANIQTLFVC